PVPREVGTCSRGRQPGPPIMDETADVSTLGPGTAHRNDAGRRPAAAGGALGLTSGPTSRRPRVRHVRTTDLADRVLVVNPGGYVDESTRRESPTPGTPACRSRSPSRLTRRHSAAGARPAPGSTDRPRGLRDTADHRHRPGGNPSMAIAAAESHQRSAETLPSHLTSTCPR